MVQETYLQKANSNQECLDSTHIKLDSTMYIRLGLFWGFLFVLFAVMEKCSLTEKANQIKFQEPLNTTTTLLLTYNKVQQLEWDEK